MRWLNENDINLNSAIEVLKSEMAEVLELADKCDADPESEYYTAPLRITIQRFLEDH